MRIMVAVPEARERLEEGSVNLSTLSQLQTFINREEKVKETKLDQKAKSALLNLIENKSQRECEREFVKISPLTVSQKESERAISEDLTEIKFIASKELVEKLNELRKILGHRGVQKTADLVSVLADIALKQARNTKASRLKTKKEKTKIRVPAGVSLKTQEKINSPGESNMKIPIQATFSTRSRYIPLHIRAFALGGRTEPENLRLLCSTHNALHAAQTFSRRHMERFLGPSLSSG